MLPVEIGHFHLKREKFRGRVWDCKELLGLMCLFGLLDLQRKHRISPQPVEMTHLERAAGSLRFAGADECVRPYTSNLLLRLLRWGLGHRFRRGQILARRYIRYVGQARDLALGGVIDADAGMVEQLTGGTIQFKPRFFVGGHRGEKRRFRVRERAPVLQDRRSRRGAELIFLLLGVEGLLGIIHGSLSGSHAGAVLFHAELRVADFDTDFVFGLLESHLGLSVLQFGPNLQRLSGTIAQWDVELQAHAFIGRGGVDQLV